MVMNQRDALAVIAAQRGGRIVMPTMGAISIWPQLSDTELDFAYMPSSMGQGPALALGLALAQSKRGVICLCGDGSLLMNLGCLVTIAEHPADVWIILIDNRQYEITGGQPVPGRTDFAGVARAAGIQHVHAFDDFVDWQQHAASVLANPGPGFIWLRVEGQANQRTPTPPHPMAEQIERLQRFLGR